MNDSQFPSIDVITPVYNRAKYLESLYFSIAQHKIIKNWIIIDDGSEDSPEHILESLRLHPSLQIIYKRIDKSGFNFSLNIGFNFLLSQYFLKIDSDDLLKPNFSDCFEKAFKIIQQQKKISSIYGFSFRTSDSEGNLIGSLEVPDIYRIATFPPTYLCKYSYMRVYGNRSEGDLLDVFESSFVKYHFRYPLFSDENKSPTSLLHTTCALYHSKKYIAYVDASVLTKNYLPDGITQLKKSDLRKNPKSYFR